MHTIEELLHSLSEEKRLRAVVESQRNTLRAVLEDIKQSWLVAEEEAAASGDWPLSQLMGNNIASLDSVVDSVFTQQIPSIWEEAAQIATQMAESASGERREIAEQIAQAIAQKAL